MFELSLLTATDKETIKNVVESMCDSTLSDELRFCEIGTYTGSTAWAIKEIVESKSKKLNYWGVDCYKNDYEHVKPNLFSEANMVVGDSTKVFYRVPNLSFDILFIDGCHHSQNVMLDFLNFSPKVKVGGIVMFHDASPTSQGCYENPPNQESIDGEIGTYTLIGLKKLGLLDNYRTDWSLVSHNWTSENYGGISVFRRML